MDQNGDRHVPQFDSYSKENDNDVELFDNQEILFDIKLTKIIERILSDDTIFSRTESCSTVKLRTTMYMTLEDIVKCSNILLPLASNTFKFLIHNNFIELYYYTRDDIDNVIDFVAQMFEYKSNFFSVFQDI